MASYRDRIIKVLQDSEDGLTTVEVARRAGISKTTVIKYLSVLKSEGKCEFSEVGPSKLWKSNVPPEQDSEAIDEVAEENKGLFMEISDICDGVSDEVTVSVSFKVKPDQLCTFMKQIRRCTRKES